MRASLVHLPFNFKHQQGRVHVLSRYVEPLQANGLMSFSAMPVPCCGVSQLALDVDVDHNRIEELVNSGASIEHLLALFLAASNKKPVVIELLVRLGGRRLVNQQDPHRQTPLHVAAGCRDTACIKVLLDNGADRNIRDRKGRTPAQAIQAVESDNAKFRREFGLDMIQKTPAMRATEAAECVVGRGRGEMFVCVCCLCNMKLARH